MCPPPGARLCAPATCGPGICESRPPCPGSDAGYRDSGTDTGAGDAAPDGQGPDALDAAIDASVEDGCSGDPSDPCWVPIEWPTIPTFCVASRALHPERIELPPQSDCGTGCARWEMGNEWSVAFNPPNGWAGADGNNYIWLYDGRARLGYLTNLLMRTDGTIVFAVSYQPFVAADERACWVRAATARDGFAAFNLYWGEGPSLSPAQNLLFNAPIDELSTVPDPVSLVDGDFGREATVLDVSAHGFTWTLLGGETAGMLDGVPFTGFAGQHPTLVATDILTTDSGEIHLREADGTSTTLFNVAPRSFLSHALTDGTSIAWFDFVDTGAAMDTPMTLTLHAAPYARTAAEFTPRDVVGPPGLSANEVVMGGGFVAHTDANATVTSVIGYRVVDLATGAVRRFRFAADEGEAPNGLFLVSADELVFMTWNAGSTVHRLYVVDPATLPLVP